MDRRSFLRQATGRAAEAAVRGLEARARARAKRWARPPYAVDELEFLLGCTRCGACQSACPHGVIFALPARLGADVAGTPALDLAANACRLCADWPCVAACEAGVLQDPEMAPDAPAAPPRLALARIDPRRCLPHQGPECGACAGSCPVPGALIWEAGRPRIDARRCAGCALCRQACILEPPAIGIHPRPSSAPEPD